MWKNANAYIGTTGNPLGIDFWTNSVYDIGQAISHVVTADAISGWVFGGGVHKSGCGGLYGVGLAAPSLMKRVRLLMWAIRSVRV